MNPDVPQPASRREFLGAAAFALAGLAAMNVRLGAQEAPKPAPVKRPPNPFIYKFKIGETKGFQNSRNQFDTRSMNGCIYYFQIMLLLDDIWIDAQTFNHVNISDVELRTDQMNIMLPSCPFYIVYTYNFLYFLYYVLIMRRHELSTIVEIGFVAIVFSGIV